MRIAILAEKLGCGNGFFSILDHVIYHLIARGHRVLLFAPQDTIKTGREAKLVELPTFGLPFGANVRVVSPFAARGMIRENLSTFRPDIVHLMNPVVTGLLGMRAARSLRVPVVASYHAQVEGWPPPYHVSLSDEARWAYQRCIYNSADVRLCPSDFTRFQLQLKGFRGMEVWGRGVNVQLFHPQRRSEAWRRRLSGGSPEAPLLLYTGHLSSNNGLRVLRDMLDQVQDVRLAIAGQGSERDEVKRVLGDRGTVFLGQLQDFDLACAYASADLLVTTGGEGSTRSILEGMASGLPVVAAATGAGIEFVSDCERGFLFWPDDADDLAEAVRLFLSYHDYGRRLGRRARAYAEAHSWSKAVGRLLAHYERALVQHRTLDAALGRWTPIPELRDWLPGVPSAAKVERVSVSVAMDDSRDT